MSISSETESEFEEKVFCTPSHLQDLVHDIDEVASAESLLPVKSKELYQHTYLLFNKWKERKGIKSPTTESVMMTYFNELAKAKKPSTLWTTYSKLKSTVIMKENVDIGLFKRLLLFLKAQNNGYKCKKSKVFSAGEIKKFLREAPDDTYLAIKVVLIFGINGSCKGGEFIKITLDNIKNCRDSLQVNLPITQTSNNTAKSFTIKGEMYNIVRKYQSLRPRDCVSDRFFIGFRKGKCTVQAIGINMFARMPKQVAEFLQLKDVDRYTGHCFRRTSLALLAKAGENNTLLNLEECNEDIATEGINCKRKLGRSLTESINLGPSTSNESFAIEELPINKIKDEPEVIVDGWISEDHRVIQGSNEGHCNEESSLNESSKPLKGMSEVNFHVWKSEDQARREGNAHSSIHDNPTYHLHNCVVHIHYH